VKSKNFIQKNNVQKLFKRNKNILKKKLLISKKIDLIFNDLDVKKDSFHVLSKKFKYNFKPNNLKKYKKFNIVVIIGMGGSILGAKAIYDFLGFKIKKKFIFFDNLDEEKIHKIKLAEKDKNVCFIVISKSGNTTETLVNMSVLRKTRYTAANTIIITEKKDNTLNHFSKKNKIPLIEHKTYIGGRYSVLSEVGMVPAYLMGLDITNFRKNLSKYFKKYKKILIENTLLNYQAHASKKIKSIICLNYCSKLDNFLFWYQQLSAESLGKKNKGLLPVISSAPKDHHSLLQLFLDGPKDKIFYIFSGESVYKTKIKKNLFRNKNNMIRNKSLGKIIDSQKKAFIKVLKDKGIPYREVHIKSFSESTLGELFSYFILEIAISCKVLSLNPFDQPAVEKVKQLTKKYLS